MARRALIVGAGVGGLTAAIDLARAGIEVLVLERAAAWGGKLCPVRLEDQWLDAGPTVFTLREVFDELFADAGHSLAGHVKLTPARVLARHLWREGDQLDLCADLEETLDRFAAFGGTAAARSYAGFVRESARIYQLLERSFMKAQRPNLLGLARKLSWRGPAIRPFQTLWQALGRHFEDPRLRQLFARYSTYCGASPFLAPATLMLIAHVERAGVWYIEGGMHRLAEALGRVALAHGAQFRFECEAHRLLVQHGRAAGVEVAGGERLFADWVIFNGDTNALAAGLLGEEAIRATAPTDLAQRSLSAMTWNLIAPTRGAALAHHTVCFSPDYGREFAALRRMEMPDLPTIYVCAQDRCDGKLITQPEHTMPERLLCLINAPAIGDRHSFSLTEIESCESRVFERLNSLGLLIEPHGRPRIVRTPNEFHRLFPGTGGALYGPASHGWRASFKRAASLSRLPGLYLAGGSVHPGPGVPMAAISGRLAAARILSDFDSMRGSRPTATRGGTSMP